MLLLLLIIILQFDPPHNRLNTRFFKVKPTLRNVRDWDDIFVRWSQVCKGFCGSLMKEIDYFYVGECDLDFIFCFITSILNHLWSWILNGSRRCDLFTNRTILYSKLHRFSSQETAFLKHNQSNFKVWLKKSIKLQENERWLLQYFANQLNILD